jgi:signal transduction histidine kinase
MSQENIEIVGFVTAFFIILASFITGALLYLRQYRKKKLEHEEEKNSLQEQHQLQLMQTQLNSQQQTMHHIGREIHDSVGQKLTLASIYTKQMTAENDKAAAIYSLIDESLRELRQLSKSLTDPELLTISIHDLLMKEAERVNASGACYLRIEPLAAPDNLEPGEKNTLFRLLQEFIQNSLKHAACRNITISFLKDDAQLVVHATDDGKGFELQANNAGNGLYNMKRRAEELKAELLLNSRPGSGTQLTIKIPVA